MFYFQKNSTTTTRIPVDEDCRLYNENLENGKERGDEKLQAYEDIQNKDEKINTIFKNMHF